MYSLFSLKINLELDYRSAAPAKNTKFSCIFSNSLKVYHKLDHGILLYRIFSLSVVHFFKTTVNDLLILLEHLFPN